MSFAKDIIASVMKQGCSTGAGGMTCHTMYHSLNAGALTHEKSSANCAEPYGGDARPAMELFQL